MKLMIAMGLLLTVAVAQTPAQPVQTESQAPSLVVTFAGERGSSYHFKVTNTSSHAVTAFALRLVPGGISKVDGRFACEGACTRSVTLADNAKPAIKAGASVDLGIGSSSVSDGTVVAEAAVFDDESYEGNERAAALLVAQQLGRQAEYNRLIAAINSVMITRADDVRKTTQIRIKLGEVSVGLDPAMVQTFKRWFPALASCTNRYARFMKAAATREKALVTNSMEQFAHGTAPGSPSLTQWWSAMQQQLASFGCNGCAALAMGTKAPASSQNAAQPCHEDLTPILLTASLADDGSLAEAEEDLEMEAELSEEDQAALDADVVVPYTRIPLRQPTRAAVVEPSAKTDVPANTPSQSPKPVAPVLPSGIPLIPAPDGKGYLLGRRDFLNRPVPDYMMYRAFFRDISNFGDMALYKVVRWDLNGQRVENRGPRAGGLNNAEIAIFQQAATATNRQVGVVLRKKDAFIRTKILIYPSGWIFYAPPIAGLRQLDVQEAQTLNTGIQRLRLKLGAASFARLDSFARSVYHAKPGKLVLTHLTDDAIHGRFFQYLALLDGMADSVTAQQEEAKRQHELRAAGFAEKDWALLVKAAKDYKQLLDSLYNPVQVPTGTSAPGQIGAMAPAIPSMATRAYPAGHLAPADAQPKRVVPVPTLTLAEAMHSNPIMLNELQVAQGMPVPLGTLSLTAEALRKEYERKRDELELGLMTDIAQLKAGFGEPQFQKFEDYLHQLYADAGVETAVPAEEKVKKVEAQAQQGKK